MTDAKAAQSLDQIRESDAERAAEFSSRIRGAQFHALVGELPFMAAAHTLSALVLVAFLWGTYPSATLLSWAGMVAVAAAYWVIHAFYYHKAPVRLPPSDRVFTNTTIWSLIMGALWGSAALLIFSSGTNEHQFLLVFIATVLTAGAVTASTSMLTAGIGYILISATPIAIGLLALGQSVHIAMGGLYTFFIASSLVFAIRGNRAFINAVKAGYDVQWLARQDTLTGLANRAEFREQLARAIDNAKRSERSLALMMIDLGDFKAINDALGYESGDEILRAIAERLKECLRRTDTVGRLEHADTIARLGGDEFAIIGANLKDTDGAAVMAQHILSQLTNPFLIDGEPVHISVNIGITLCPDDHDNAEDLIRDANVALDRSRKEQRNSYKFFDQITHKEVEYMRGIQQDMRRGIESGEFSLHYQPQIDLTTGAVVGVEALARWTQPDRGAVSPMTFIPVAEATGLITPLSEWILMEACGHVQEWRKKGLPEFTVAINISPVHMRHPQFIEHIEHALNTTGLPSECLELEMTEHSVFDSNEVEPIMAELQRLGIHLSVDDFGTGYSSMAYLKKFPISKLKIDQSFVQDLGNGNGSGTITNAIIQLAHNLKLNIIAEGVETEEQAKVLLEYGCTWAQGYLYAKPLPAEDFFHWVRRYNVTHRTKKVGLAPSSDEA